MLSLGLNIFKSIIRILITSATVIVIFSFSSSYLVFKVLEMYQTLKKSPVRSNGYIEEESESRAYVIRFLNETGPILKKSIARIQWFKKLETGEYAVHSQGQIDKWHQLSKIARKEVIADLAFLEEYSNTNLQEHVNAKQLIIKALSYEIKLWREYDIFVEIKSHTKDKKREEEIERNLSSHLRAYYRAFHSLGDYYKRKLEGFENENIYWTFK